MSERWYDIPQIGKKFPSVTTVLNILDKPYLLKWKINKILDYVQSHITPHTIEQVLEEARKQPKEIAQDAATVGSKAHELISHYFTHETEIKDPLSLLEKEEDFRVHACFRAFNQWRIQNQYHSQYSEYFVWSGQYKLAGTLDSVGTFAGQRSLVLLDFKSSNSLWPIYDLQCAAYSKLFEKQEGCTIKKAFLVQLGKNDGTFDTKEISKPKLIKDWGTVSSVIKVFYRMRELNQECDKNIAHI